MLISFDKGSKWAFLAILSFMCLAVGLLFKDKVLFGLLLLAGTAGIGVQYKLLTHGQGNLLVDHYGGALAEPVLNMIDFSIFFLIFVFVIDLAKNQIQFPKWTKLDSLLLFFLFACLPSLYVTHEYALFFWEMFRYGKYYLLYWILRTYLNQPLYYWALMVVSVSLLALHGFVSLLQYFLFFTLPVPVGGVSGSHFEMVGNEVLQRVTGVLGHSNTFAAYLSIILSIAVIFFFLKIPFWIKSMVIPFILLGSFALILTFSRNGWMIFAIECIGLVVLLLVKKRLNPGYLISFFLVGILGIGLLVVSGVGETILIRIFDDDGKAFDSRWDLLNVGWQMVQTHPFVGIGLNSFEENMVVYDLTRITNVIQQPVHNTYMLIAAETGLLSLFLFLGILYSMIRRSWNILAQQGELAFALGSVGLCLFLGQGLSNHFDVTLRKEPILALVVMIGAMVISYGENLPGILKRTHEKK